jgi:phosphatidylserine/phosphatidylglycerophosphate/cardiolipin synthase-like enzyme
MLLLSRRWEVYNRNLAPLPVRHSCHSIAERETPLEESLTSRLIDELASPLVDLTTTVPRFASSKRRARDVAVTILTTGPEARAESAFEREILRRVREARRRILVNQMYFHPTRRILEALTEAARRGVPVTVITNGTHGNDRRSCPHSHFFFAQRSKYNWARLIRRVPAAWRERVQVFEFEQRQKGNHKKVMIIDDHVLGGSGNLGYKSLVTMSDHEINFRATSPRLAEETARIFEQDIGCSREVTAETRLTLNEYFKTATHRMLAPLYG